MSVKGIVYNIQRYSLHDGPGIRTIVFLKGCPLRCRWCCNPESQNPEPELSYVQAKCIGKEACGFCEKACGTGAISFDPEGRAVLHREHCIHCLQCAASCPAKAIRVEGYRRSVPEVMNTVEQDAVFYRHIGGLTVSGGEPLMQGNFLLELLQEAKVRKIHTAMETCGFSDYAVLKQAAALLDTILYDIKSLNDVQHQKYTGQSNAVILKNFERLCDDFPTLPKQVRTPVIPGFNDSVEDIGEICKYLKGKPGVSFEPLPYHRYGAGKYAMLGRQYSITGSLDAKIMRQIRSLY